MDQCINASLIAPYGIVTNHIIFRSNCLKTDSKIRSGQQLFFTEDLNFAIKLFLLFNGPVATWSYDLDGDFTHTPIQWKSKAWFQPELHADTLVFKILFHDETFQRKEASGIYHGRFIEMPATHFSHQFSTATSLDLNK